MSKLATTEAERRRIVLDAKIDHLLRQAETECICHPDYLAVASSHLISCPLWRFNVRRQ